MLTFALTVAASFIGCLLAMLFAEWFSDVGWPEINWPEIRWGKILPAELGLGLTAIVLIDAAFVAVMRTGEYAVTGQFFLAAVDSVVALLLGLSSISAFAFAARRWWKKSPRPAWTPFVLAIVWTTTAGYLFYVGVIAGWGGNWTWGVFNAVGAAASAGFAIVPLFGAIRAKRMQRKLARAQE